ncbi:MAG: hypothetical protein ACLQU3_06845 [Limisphaerales bacterium]
MSLRFGFIWCDAIALSVLGCTFVTRNVNANDTRILNPTPDKLLLKTL